MSIEALGGNTQGRADGCAPAEPCSCGQNPAQIVPSAGARPGSRDAAAELLDGIGTALAVEVETCEDDDAQERIVFLLADVFDAHDYLLGVGDHGVS
jgi:hypothetical protein